MLTLVRTRCSLRCPSTSRPRPRRYVLLACFLPVRIDISRCKYTETKIELKV
uniref:Uncharacterized protein n=1 Tax=Triticum urartu TaxID=4572 RepID=A0A8R7PCZ1_TRIUA